MSPLHFIKRAALAVTLFGFAAAAQAQTVLFVDVNRVLEESSVGRSVESQLTTIAQTIQGELQPTASSLAQEQQQLLAEASALTPEAIQQNTALTARIQEYETRTQSFQIQQAQAQADLQATQQAALQTIFEAMGPVMDALRAERSAAAVLNTSSAVSIDPSLDITADAIARLDQTLPNTTVQRVSAPSVTAGTGQ